MHVAGMQRAWKHIAAGLWSVGVATVGLGAGTALAQKAVPTVVTRDSGTWDLVFEKANRRCRLFLRDEVHLAGYGVAMPATCHLAFPLLEGVTNWAPGDDEHVQLRNDAGGVVLDFGPTRIPALTATLPDGDVYTLTPINPAVQRILRAAPADDEAKPATAAAEPASGVVVDRSSAKGKTAARGETAIAPVLPPVTAADVAGNYAVLRDDRDTGCMVTLEASGRETRAGQRARLAPACRDQGIVIFDPAEWQLSRGQQLVLTAKRGHTTALTRRDARSWANTPARGAALVLKRL